MARTKSNKVLKEGTITIRLLQQDKEVLSDIAYNKGLSVSSLLNILIKKFIEENVE